MSKQESIYYDINDTLTHNCLFNFVCGNRSAGKTYGFKKWAIKDWIKTKNQFGYIRRYESEVNEGKLERFFDDVGKEFPEYEFKVSGLIFYIREQLKPNEIEIDDKGNIKKNDKPWEVIGYCFILSKAVTFKSVPYPHINKLLFDEFLIEKGVYRYLPDEVFKLNDLYTTVARPGTDHIRVIIFFMANAITFTNIYFLSYGLKPPAPNKEYYKPKGKSILLQMVAKDSMVERQKKTEFGKIVEGTTYEKYAFENKFYMDDSTFIERKTNNAKYYFTINFMDNKFGLWLDYEEGILYVSEKVDPCCKIEYALTQKDHKPNTMLIRSVNKSIYLKSFIDCYKDGNVRFENMKIKNICYDVIKMLIVR